MYTENDRTLEETKKAIQTAVENICAIIVNPDRLSEYPVEYQMDLKSALEKLLEVRLIVNGV